MIFNSENVWRIERAERAAVLVDGAAFFGAVRAALRQARHSVLIVGWDIHSQTRLVGASGEADDGYPPLLAAFLSALVRDRPELTIRLLLWDYSMLYATERELFPQLTLNWRTPPQVHFCLDNAVPVGSSQHQKLVIVDDAVAFSGGLDLTIRRWDTTEHAIENPRRVDPLNKPYRPFHDVQMVVDGAAAQALGDIARARWASVAGDPVTAAMPATAPWPAGLRPDFEAVEVAIARTQPLYADEPEIREVEQLFFDSIDAADRSIYIENQFLTCNKIAERLARRLRAQPKLELVIVAPRTQETWIEAHAMRNGRIRFMRTIAEAQASERVRIVYPDIAQAGKRTDTMIHSKVMVVDDRLLRVGSANLNNRSMGTDTECDLAIEAKTADERSAILAVRDRLLAEHCGVAPPVAAAAIAEFGSLVRAADTLSGNGHRLCPIDDGGPDPAELAAYLEGIADPERPIAIEVFGTWFENRLPLRRRSALVKTALACLVLIGLLLAWRFTPLSELADPDWLRENFTLVGGHPLAPVIVIAIFVAAGLVAFPLLVLIAVTAAAFGPWLGMLYGAIGALSSAIVTYALGAKLGRETLRNLLGPRLERIRARIARRGVIAVATVRLVPVAPFTVVNLVAGASAIRPLDFIAGTALGLLPGLIVMSVLGHQVFRILTEPTALDIVLLITAILVWIAVSIGVQILVSKLWSSRN